MKHLAAYMLLTLGGNASPSAANVKEVLQSVGIDAEEERLEKLLSELEGKDIQEVRHTFNFPREPPIQSAYMITDMTILLADLRGFVQAGFRP